MKLKLIIKKEIINTRVEINGIKKTTQQNTEKAMESKQD